jgi:hypothetical protein
LANGAWVRLSMLLLVLLPPKTADFLIRGNSLSNPDGPEMEDEVESSP